MPSVDIEENAMKYRGGQKGVTLIELLIAIGIVAIFASMACLN